MWSRVVLVTCSPKTLKNANSLGLQNPPLELVTANESTLQLTKCNEPYRDKLYTFAFFYLFIARRCGLVIAEISNRGLLGKMQLSLFLQRQRLKHAVGWRILFKLFQAADPRTRPYEGPYFIQDVTDHALLTQVCYWKSRTWSPNASQERPILPDRDGSDVVFTQYFVYGVRSTMGLSLHISFPKGCLRQLLEATIVS